MVEHLSPARTKVVLLSVGQCSRRGNRFGSLLLFKAVNGQPRVIAGDYFLDVRRSLVDGGLAALGITPPPEDTDAVAADAAPPSLRLDGTHFTTEAQTAIGAWLLAQLGALGS